jgi:hypothetical protein
MAEPIQSYVARQFQKYDRNGDHLIQATPIPILAPYPEVGGRVGDYFSRNSALGQFGVGMMDSYSLGNAVYRDVDNNHDGQVDLLERIIGWFKTGMW